MTYRTLAASTLIFLSLSVLLQPALATNDPPSSGGLVSGDWTVTDARSYSNVPITMYGDLVIRSGGSLTLSGRLCAAPPGVMTRPLATPFRAELAEP